MSDQMTALTITLAVTVTLVFWVPAIHCIARRTRNLRPGHWLVRRTIRHDIRQR
jgi:hypothetical protein